MKLAKFKALKASLKTAHGIEKFEIKETKDKYTGHRIAMYDKVSEAFHDTHIITLCEALNTATYINYDKSLNRCVLHIF